MQKNRVSVALATLALAGLVTTAGIAGSATAAGNREIRDNSVTSSDIKNQTIQSADIAENAVGSSELRASSVGLSELAPAAETWIKEQVKAGPQGPAGKDGVDGTDGVDGKDGADGVDGKDGKDAIATVTTDGPYPGDTQLTHGANSTEKWAGDSGAALQTSWVQCAEGETAIGGGFSRADEGAAAIKNLQIVSSSPALIVDGEVISVTGAGLADHIVNDDWSYVPNGWVVEGFNNGGADLIVRPHVICASVNS